MKKIIIVVIGLFALSLTAKCQISGTVVGPDNKGIPGVNVYWSDSKSGTVTDNNGEFQLAHTAKQKQLIFSFVGYVNDTLEVSGPLTGFQIQLKSNIKMDEFVVQERKQTTSYDQLEIKQVENIDSGELTKAACCNVSEAFETNASVDVVASDGVTGAKKIQMLGLDGVYTAVQFENIPMVRGLANYHGLSLIPGTWVDGIQISKGTGSVINGYEPMTGQINLELLKPDELKERLFINLYSNVMGRMEMNAHVGNIFNKKWSTLALIHSNTNQLPLDNNNDGFLDLTLKKQVNFLNRWKYKGERYRAQFGVRVVSDQSVGGQLNFDPASDRGTTQLFGTGSTGNLIDVFGKNGFLFKEHVQRSIALIVRGTLHEQNWYSGLREYTGREEYWYTNLIFQDIIGTTEHNYKLGLSYVYDNYNETFNGSNFKRTEMVPGFFGEYTYKREKFGAVLGTRTDFHNLFGTQISPKVNLKYNFSKRGTVRASLGRGFRVPNRFVDNASVYISQRVINMEQEVQPEIAWNTGGGITQKLELAGRDLTLHGEYFYTQFEDQLIYDRETTGALSIYNLNGRSYSHAVQVELGYEPFKVLDFKVAGKYLDVKSTYGTTLKQVPLVPTWRGMFNIGYQTLSSKWQADFTVQYVGVSRIPSTQGNLPANQVAETSDPYFLMNAQLTRRFRWIEVYVGSENIGDYRQQNAILSADQPFNGQFDASLIWGPIFGRSLYAGVRLKLFKL